MMAMAKKRAKRYFENNEVFEDIFQDY